MMADPSDNNSIAYALGKIDGQMREVIHKQSNMEQKLDDLVERGFKAATADDIERLAKRIDALESTNDRNDGAKGALMALMQSRAFGVLVTAVLSALGAIAVIKGGLFK